MRGRGRGEGGREGKGKGEGKGRGEKVVRVNKSVIFFYVHKLGKLNTIVSSMSSKGPRMYLKGAK